MNALSYLGDAVGAVLIALAVPVAILAIGAPVVLGVRLVLAGLGLL